MANRENKYIPNTVSLPGETLSEILEERCMTQKELAERMNRPEKTINEIIKGKSAITADTALQLEKVLGTPSHFWIQREAFYQESIARYREYKILEDSQDWLKTLPLAQMIKYRWVPKANTKIEQLQEVLKFFGVASVESWKSLWLYTEPKAAFRISLAYTNENGAIAAWLRHGEIAIQNHIIPEYDEKVFKKNLNSIRALTIKKQECLKPEIKHFCNEAGVNIVFSPIIQKATISGAVRWVANRPLIQLSLRGKYNDRFWFTFFHEAGHILLHGKKDFFLEGTDNGVSVKEKEIQADEFAADFLIPKNKLQEFISKQDKSPNAMLRFSREIGVHVGIVIGQLQSRNYIPYSYLNDMKALLKIEMD